MQFLAISMPFMLDFSPFYSILLRFIDFEPFKFEPPNGDFFLETSKTTFYNDQPRYNINNNLRTSKTTFYNNQPRYNIN